MPGGVQRIERSVLVPESLHGLALARVRAALAHHLGLDVPGVGDGALVRE